MSLARVQKSGGSRLPDGVERNSKLENRSQSLQLAPVPGSNNKPKQVPDTLSSQSWNSRINEVTSRLSRHTIASSLKRVNYDLRWQDGDRNSQFWNTMAYCSNEYQRRFDTADQSSSRGRHGLTGSRSRDADVGNRNESAPSGSGLGHQYYNVLPSLNTQPQPAHRQPANPHPGHPR